MSTRRISQRDALKMRRELIAIRAAEQVMRNRYAKTWPGGTPIWSIKMAYDAKAAMTTARALRHMLVAVPDGDDLKIFALREGE
jgi:hypothetical protein